jgi:hypothetical protein
MRPSLPAKAPATGLPEGRRPMLLTSLTSPTSASAWPAGFSSLPKAPILTALEVQFRGVENLIRALDGLTWAPAVRRRRR